MRPVLRGLEEDAEDVLALLFGISGGAAVGSIRFVASRSRSSLKISFRQHTAEHDSKGYSLHPIGPSHLSACSHSQPGQTVGTVELKNSNACKQYKIPSAKRNALHQKGNSSARISLVMPQPNQSNLVQNTQKTLASWSNPRCACQTFQ